MAHVENSSLRPVSRLRWFGVIFLIGGAILCPVILLHVWGGIPIRTLTRDPVAVGELPVYAGVLSQTGIFFWAATATLCIFGASILSRTNPHSLLKQFLVISALLTLLLGLDDTFLLHEQVFPRFGIAQHVVLGSYAIFMLLYLVRFRQIILETDYVLLATALALFGISVLLDVTHPYNVVPYLFEDGAKLTGLVSWTAYFFSVSLYAVARRDM